MKHPKFSNFGVVFAMTLAAGLSSPGYAASLAISDSPLFTSTTEPPLTMLVMGKDHKLYYEAYNDASDLNGDKKLDIGYQGYQGFQGDPKLNVDYYGYFNPYVCYTYSGNAKNDNPSLSDRFVPSSSKDATAIEKKDKTCAGANEWSGDFLNYVTTARIDALRRVFYGGSRSTDTASLTVLERSHIPQDAHTWGKEYESELSDGFDIRDYTPLNPPAVGTRHLFANVSLSSPSGGSMNSSAQPRMRVLNDSEFRIWDWVAKEIPVSGDQCDIPGRNCEVFRSTPNWALAPSSMFRGLIRTYYTLGSNNEMNNAGDFDTTINANLGNAGTPTPVTDFNGIRNRGERYITVVGGQFIAPSSGFYEFAVDGDDAVEFSVKTGPGSGDYSVIASWYGNHGANTGLLDSHSGRVYLSAGAHTVRFRHHENFGGDSYNLYFRINPPSSVIDEYAARVEACNAIEVQGANSNQYCQRYPNGNYKPVGLLHEFGEDERMMFGLLSGSYEKNLDGGVLRKAVSSFTDEINPLNGTFTSVKGIVASIDALRTVNFNGSYYNCGWISGRPINRGECDMWGNPVAEMMYESLRYFSGKTTPTPQFDIANTGNNDASLGLPKAAWSDPYDPVTGYNECAAPFQVVLTDINPSYDSDLVPGSRFSNFTGDITDPKTNAGLNVTQLASEITNAEGGIKGKNFFIGESIGTANDTSPTPKVVDHLGTIRGMAPEEPTKLGSYYSASLAYYGLTRDINARAGDQNLQTFSVALASPLPRIEIDIDQDETTNNSIIIVPFAKTSFRNRGTTGFFPTNQIVDFFVESLGPTSGSFLVNFEDVEQGADHDMDAVARYRYQINQANKTVTISVESVYSAGGHDHRMGYVISGSNHDGVYLDVHDRDSTPYVFHLDTPQSIWAGEPRGNDLVGLFSSRTFSSSGVGAAGILKDPLWYAAKWGGFIENKQVANDLPDIDTEWDNDGDGDPDNYFLVTNALTLKQQMEDAFDEVLARSGAASSLAANSGSLDSNSVLYQATFRSGDWYGELRAIDFANGVIGRDLWNASDELEKQLASTNGFNANREMITINDAGRGIPFKFPQNYNAPTATEMSTAQANLLLQGAVSANLQSYGTSLVNYLRGDASNERVGNNFRDRTKPLGDIVHSDPLYVIQPGFFYPDKWPTTVNGKAALAPENSAAKTYTQFRRLMKDRLPVIYFGANDGALHAVNAYTNSGSLTGQGQEILAYVPGEVYGNLAELAKPRYQHKYYVDGKTTYGDVFFSQGTTSADQKWHTVLVGALRAGGQGIYALDITDPHGIAASEGYPSFDESKANDLVLWEFTDEDDADLGFTFGRPKIARLANGKWVAIFGNGYDNTENDGLATTSTSGNAAIYVVDIETGTLIKKFDTGVGTLQDPLNTARPNGMSEITAVDLNRDEIVDVVYAGDLFGNIWKLDLRDVNPSNWAFANTSGGNPAPIFVATAADGTTRLPITTRVNVGTHPVFGYRGDTLVFFGTGKYFENGDTEVRNQPTQSIFGIWDDGTYGFDRSDLAVQTIRELRDGGVANGTLRRYFSDNEVRWEDRLSSTGSVVATKHGGWVLNLIDSSTLPLNNEGERMISNLQLSEGRLIGTSFAPSVDPCQAGGSGWLMAINAATGGVVQGAVFDTNNDGVIDDNDLVDTDGDGVGDSSAGGAKSGGGIADVNVIDGSANSGTGKGIIIGATNDGDKETGDIKMGDFLNRRLNWRELR